MARTTRDINTHVKEAELYRGEYNGAFRRTRTFKTVQDAQRFYGESGLEGINLNFVDCTGKYFEFEYMCENNIIKSAFNDTTDSTPLASFIIKSDNVKGEKWINYKPYNCVEVSGVATDNEIKYTSVYTDTDITYKNLQNNIKQLIELSSNSAPKVFDFTITKANKIDLVVGSLPVVDIQYTGSGISGTIEVNSNHIIGEVDSVEDFNLDLTNSNYDTLTEVVNYINALDDWTASLIGGCGTCRSKTFVSINASDCKTTSLGLEAYLKDVTAVNEGMPNSRSYWKVSRPFAISDRNGMVMSHGFVDLIPASEHENGTYDVVRVTIDESWVSDEFTAGATKITIDPTTYKTIKDYGNITFLGDYENNQHGSNGFMNGYGLIDRGTEAVQSGGTRCDKDNNVANLTFVDRDGTETAGSAATIGEWTYSASYWYTNLTGAKVKYTSPASTTEVWGRFYLGTSRGIVKATVNGVVNYVDLYNGSNLTDRKVLLATGLTAGALEIEIEVFQTQNISSSDNYTYFYGFETYTSGNELAPRGAITINSRSTYGLDCDYTKHPNGIQYDARGNLANDTGGDSAKGFFSCWAKMGFAYNADSDKHWIMGKEADSEVAGDMRLYYDGSDDKFHFAIYNGADWTTCEVTTAAQTFSANDVIHVACGWDETLGTYLYIDNTKTSDNSTWTAVDLAGNVVIGNDPVSPSSSEEADMIIAEPTFFDYLLTDGEVQDRYESTEFIGNMDFGRRVEVLNRTNKGLLFNYSGVGTASHRTGSFAGKLYDTSAPAGTNITKAQMIWSGTWTASGNVEYSSDRNAYATATFTGTEIWAVIYAEWDVCINEYIIDEGTPKEIHVIVDPYKATPGESRYFLLATGLDNISHTIKVKPYQRGYIKNFSATNRYCFVGHYDSDQRFIYATSGSENISSATMTVNNRLIDNVLDCNYTDMPKAIQFPDKGNISEYDLEGTFQCWFETGWAGNDANTHYFIDTTDGTDNGMKVYHDNGNLRFYFYNGAGGSINISGVVNATNWAADTTHHVVAKWWRPTSSTMGLTLYLDGVKLAENKSQSLTPVDHTAIVIGADQSPSSSDDFDGIIYDQTIYNHAMSDGGVAVSSSASSGSEVYNSYNSIAKKYKEDLSDQVDGVKTTFYLERGLVLKESDALAYDDGADATISSFKEGTWCRTNGAISASDTTIVVDSHTNAESEIDTNGGYLWIGQANSLWRKKVEYSAYDAGTNTFTVADSGTVGEDFVDNTIIEVCGTVTLSVAPTLASELAITYYFSGDSLDIEYGLAADNLNKNLLLDTSGTATTGWQLNINTAKSGMQRVYSNVKGQIILINTLKQGINFSVSKDSAFGISQLISNQGTKEEKQLLVDAYNASLISQNLIAVLQGLNVPSIIRVVNGVDKNASASDYYGEIESLLQSSQYDLTVDSLNSNEVNCVFDFSAIRVVDGELYYDKDKSGNLQLSETLDTSEIAIDIDTDTAADLDKLGKPNGIIKIENEFIYYRDIDFTSSTTATLHNCIRGYLSELTGGAAASHNDNTSIQLVGAWRNNVNARNQSWWSSDGAFPYRALLIGCGTEDTIEGGLVIRDIAEDKNYMVFEANANNIAQSSVVCVKGHTGKISIGYGTEGKGISDIDFIQDETLCHKDTAGTGYGSAAATKGTIAERNAGLGWSYTTNTGVTLTTGEVNDIAMNFDASNYDIWVGMGKSGTTGSSAGIIRIYDGGDGILDTEYDLDADANYWVTDLCYDLANDDLYIGQTNGTANQAIWSKIGTPKITSDSTIDTADGSDRLTSQAICNDLAMDDSGNIWVASDLGAKKIAKASFSSGVIDTLDSSDFSELTIDACKAIAFDPDENRLLIAFDNGSDGLLIECDTNGEAPDYYDEISETDVDRENVLVSDIIKSIVYIYKD